MNIETTAINTFLPTKNQFVYSYSIKIHASRFDKLEKHFLPPPGYGSIFPVKSCWDAWRSSRLKMVNMVDAAKLHSPVCWAFEALVVQHAVGCCCGGEFLLTYLFLIEDRNPFCWPMPAAVFSASHQFAEHTSQRCNGFSEIREAVEDQTGSRPPKPWPMTFFWCKFGIGKYFLV